MERAKGLPITALNNIIQVEVSIICTKSQDFAGSGSGHGDPEEVNYNF